MENENINPEEEKKYECDCCKEKCECCEKEAEVDQFFIDKEFDTESFEDGYTVGSYFAGFYASLISVGMPNSDAVNIILSKMENERDMYVAELTASMNTEIAKADYIREKKEIL